MNTTILKSNSLLLLTALIWGTGFVAQRAAMDYMPPLIFNGIRFSIGSLSLVPLVLWSLRQAKAYPGKNQATKKQVFWGSFGAGTLLFAGVAFQQFGLLETTAGKAGFITGLYMAIVPLFNLFFGKRLSLGECAGILLATTGLYLLSVTKGFSLAPGDGLVLISTFFWAVHMLLLASLAPRMNTIVLSFGQFAFCALFHFIAAFFTEEIILAHLLEGWFPLVYGGLLPVGVAYTLQVVAQKNVPPTHVAIILSMESLFAALGGWLILDEAMGKRAIFGCSLMLMGVLLAQLFPAAKNNRPDN